MRSSKLEKMNPIHFIFCRKHYVEHLGGLIFRHKVDPVPILESEELELCIRRANMRLPSKYQLTDAVYKDVLTKVSELFKEFSRQPFPRRSEPFEPTWNGQVCAAGCVFKSTP